MGGSIGSFGSKGHGKGMSANPVKISNRILVPHKAIVSPSFGELTVLTNSPWNFVSLWLKRNNQKKAIIYWEQARHFYDASTGLPTQSAPLLLYYSYMNMAKALLSAKSFAFDPFHGVTNPNRNTPRTKIDFSGEVIKIQTNGIIPSLSKYLGESETSNTHTLKDLLYNLPYIHRTFCITYKSQSPSYIPIKNCCYVKSSDDGKAYFRAKLTDKGVSKKSVIKKLPNTFTEFVDGDDSYIQSIDCCNWEKKKKRNIDNVSQLNQRLRKDLHYINGIEPLWYIKINPPGGKRINRYGPTITLAAMHRLSEICRYNPVELASYLSGQKNWLLSEFIEMSPIQYIDEIASEITGCNFAMPNVRPAN
jgi:hypothetical protein